MIKAIADFSKKLNKFNESQEARRIVSVSSDKVLQRKILDSEEERREKLVSVLNGFLEPFSRDVEEDEENLSKAYDLFCGILEVQKSKGSKETRLADLALKSPLCSKPEYIHGDRFSYLKVWFLKQHNDSAFVPEICLNVQKIHCICFVPKDEARFSPLEKELFGLLEM